MEKLLFSLMLVSLMGVCECGNFTVTHEAWFDVIIRNYDGPNEHFNGRFTVALFGETVPATVLNFVKISKGFGHNKRKLTYKNSNIHRNVKDLLIQMGDITVGDGSGGRSIYGEKFDDENFILGHDAPGMVSMANSGKDTNQSQFFIVMVSARWMNGKHVVFGKIINGMDVIQAINDINTNQLTGEPLKPIKIVDCDAEEVKPYDLTEEQVSSEEDIVKDKM